MLVLFVINFRLAFLLIHDFLLLFIFYFLLLFYLSLIIYSPFLLIINLSLFQLLFLLTFRDKDLNENFSRKFQVNCIYGYFLWAKMQPRAIFLNFIKVLLHFVLVFKGLYVISMIL
jgi:hypothetical protein